MDAYDFLIHLSTDPVAQRQFVTDPDGVMAAAGLTPELRAMIANRDRGALSRTLAGAPWASATTLADPSYDPPPPDDWVPSPSSPGESPGPDDAGSQP